MREFFDEDVRILVEPGRSLVGTAGVTIYTVGTIKEIDGIRTYLSVNGGMSDNLRPMLYGARYENEQFVTVSSTPPGVRDVRETNRCSIQALAGDDRIVVFSVIDNLWKGASSQAIQNLNLMLGLDESAGIS